MIPMNSEDSIFTSYFASVPHPQRSDPNTIGLRSDGRVKPNHAPYVKEWCESITKSKLSGVIFHDHLTDEFISSFSNDFVKFKKVNTPLEWSANDIRFRFYRDHLKSNKYNNIFMTDCCDVTVVQNPFQDKEYSPDSIFFGQDTQGSRLKDYNLCAMAGGFFDLHAQVEWDDSILLQISNPPLLNAGVIGGSTEHILPLLDSFCGERERIGEFQFNLNMPLLNYLARTKFSDKIKAGHPITSNFKEYQSSRKDVWFIHK